MSTPTSCSANAYTSGGSRWSVRARGSTSASTKRAYAAHCARSASNASSQPRKPDARSSAPMPSISTGLSASAVFTCCTYGAVRPGDGEPRARLRFGGVRERDGARLQPGVAAQPHERELLALDRVLLVEQHARCPRTRCARRRSAAAGARRGPRSRARRRRPRAAGCRCPRGRARRSPSTPRRAASRSRGTRPRARGRASPR